MEIAAIPVNEQARLKFLGELQILDTEPELTFDDITSLAAHICGTPIALISLVDEKRTWFKSKVGLSITESHRDFSICSHAIHQSAPFLVPDLANDQRFFDNPQIVEGRFRCYAGAPLIEKTGINFGTLCVLDFKPRMLTGEQVKALEQLSRLAVAHMELRRDQTSMNEQKMQLTTSAKMVALGEMSAGIAHEINNPLAIIVGKVSQLKGRLKKDPVDLEKCSGDLVKIEDASYRISKIIKGLKSFSKCAENDETETFPASRIIEETLALCQAKFKNQSVDLRMVEEAQAKIMGRAADLSQVLFNLLSNAFDAVLPLPEKWVEIKVTAADGKVRIIVTDSGPGIPKEVQEKLMEPFFTTKEVGKGTGLGLCASKGLVEGHGGRFYYNDESSNTSFVMELPVVDEKQST